MNSWFAGVDWATPWAGLVVLFPLIAARLARRRELKLDRWADPHLLRWATGRRGAGSSRRRLRRLDWLAWVLLGVAAAGPRLPLDTAAAAIASPAHHLDLMVVLDVSRSMAATDILPSRLDRAKLELADLAARLRGERVGLIVYAGRAGLLLPPSNDRAWFRRALSEAAPTLIGVPGTNPTDALRLAASTLESEKNAPRAVLLLTDGEAGASAAAAVRPLRHAGIPLYVLDVASRLGAPIPVAGGGFAETNGTEVVSRPDRADWRRAARATGGAYTDLADGGGSLRKLYDDGIARLSGKPAPLGHARTWRPLFGMPLAAALILFMLSRWPGFLPVLLVALCLPHPARAAPDGVYPGQMRNGVAAWNGQDYRVAAKRFGTALLMARNTRERADALYDLGEAHYALGHWLAAAEAWRGVLAMRPGDPWATANLALAEAALKRRRNALHRSDLHGRPGAAEEGIVDSDADRSTTMPALKPTKPGLLVERPGNAAQGARLTSALPRANRVAADDRLLQSGLRKLDLIEDRPDEVQRNILRQDTPPDAKHLELAPW